MSRITDRVAEVVAQSLDDLGRDDVHYEVAVNVLPTPQGPQPMLVLVLSAPALTVGDYTTTMGMIPDLVPPPEAVQDAVLAMLEGLRNNQQMERDGVMAQGKAQQNGHGQVQGPPSGLIIPGR